MNTDPRQRLTRLAAATILVVALVAGTAMAMSSRVPSMRMVGEPANDKAAASSSVVTRRYAISTPANPAAAAAARVPASCQFGHPSK